jgi:Phage integrase family
MIERAAAGAGLELKVHPRMLRHARGYALANEGHDTGAIQDWLGHRSITSTAVYTALARTGSRILAVGETGTMATRDNRFTPAAHRSGFEARHRGNSPSYRERSRSSSEAPCHVRQA